MKYDVIRTTTVKSLVREDDICFAEINTPTSGMNPGNGIYRSSGCNISITTLETTNTKINNLLM